MKSIQIRNVPDAVCSALKRKAAEEGLSLQEYLSAHVRDLASQTRAQLKRIVQVVDAKVFETVPAPIHRTALTPA